MNAEITCGLTRDFVQLVGVLVNLHHSQLPQCHFELISWLFNPSCLTLHQVLWPRQQRYRWCRRSAGSSGQSDDFGGVGLRQLLPDPSSCVAAAARCRLAEFEDGLVWSATWQRTWRCFLKLICCSHLLWWATLTHVLDECWDHMWIDSGFCSVGWSFGGSIFGVSCHSVTLNWDLSCSILPVSPCARCFGDNSKGVDGAADLLQVLGKAMTLETLNFDRCSQIPAAAWQRLHGADWRNLKIASFVE